MGRKLLLSRAWQGGEGRGNKQSWKPDVPTGIANKQVSSDGRKNFSGMRGAGQFMATQPVNGLTETETERKDLPTRRVR